MGDDGLLEGVPLDGIEHKLEKVKLEKEEDKKFIQEQSFFNNVDGAAKKKKKGVAAKVTVERPKVMMLGGGKDSWARALVGRLHNTLRKEILDMYTMMESMYSDATKVRSFHVGLFYDWWDHFSSFLFTEFEAEQEVLYRRLAGKGAEMPQCIQPERLRAYAANMQDLVVSISDSRRNAENRPPVEPLAKCLKAMEKLPIVLEFLQEVDSVLPSLLENHFNEKEGMALETDVVTYLNNNGDVNKYHVLIIMNKLDGGEVAEYKQTFCKMRVRLRITNNTAKFRVHHIRPLKEIVAHLGQAVVPQAAEALRSPLVSPTTTKTSVLAAKQES